MVKMFDSPLVVILFGYTAVVLTGVLCCVVGTSVYDLKEAKKKHKIQQHPFAKSNRFRPFISIIVYVKNDQSALISSLESIRHGTYRNCQVVVVNDSQDNGILKAAVLAYSVKYRKSIKIHILSRRKSTSRTEAMAAAEKKWTLHSELIMRLDAGSQLDKNALKNMCQHFMNKNVDILLPNVQVAPYPTFLSLFEQLDQFLQLSTRKTMSLMGLSGAGPDTSGLVYRRFDRRSLQPKRRKRIAYGANVIVATTTAPSWIVYVRKVFQQRLDALSGLYPQKLTAINRRVNVKHALSGVLRRALVFIFLLIVCLTPIVIAYLLYLAVNFKQPALYGLSWIVFSMILFGIIWGTDYRKTGNRLKWTVLIPIFYPIFYMTSLLRIFILTLVLPKIISHHNPQLKI